MEQGQDPGRGPGMSAATSGAVRARVSCRRCRRLPLSFRFRSDSRAFGNKADRVRCALSLEWEQVRTRGSGCCHVPVPAPPGAAPATQRCFLTLPSTASETRSVGGHGESCAGEPGLRCVAASSPVPARPRQRRPSSRPCPGSRRGSCSRRPSAQACVRRAAASCSVLSAGPLPRFNVF